MNDITFEEAVAVVQEEQKATKAIRKFRNRVIAGSVIVPIVKWGLITLGAVTLIGMVKNDTTDETEEI